MTTQQPLRSLEEGVAAGGEDERMLRLNADLARVLWKLYTTAPSDDACKQVDKRLHAVMNVVTKLLRETEQATD